MLTLDTAGNPYTEASANAPRDPAAEARRALNPAEGLIQSTQYFNLSHPSGYIQNPVAAGTFSSSREIGASSEQGGAGGGNSRKSSAPYVASGSAAAAALTGESLDDEARDRPWWAPVWDVAASVGTFIGDGLINLDERFWRWNNSR
ncbi:hypothetical protein KEM55_000835 [Ascosphaera atra]|nr:hypothetical protein KEM55_000835 [Ascosphaera atra]